MDGNSNAKIPIEDSIDQELAVIGSNDKSEVKKDLSFARNINDNEKRPNSNDNVITLVDKKPQTSTKLHMMTLLEKDVSTYRRLMMRGVDMGDLLNPVLYTLINSADRVVFEGANLNAKSNVKVGMLILYFTDILDRFTYLRRYLLNFEIPDRHIDIICTYPNDELPLNLLEEWKNSRKEDSPVCLSTNPDRLLLARQLVLKDSAGVGLANSDLVMAFKDAHKIDFVLDYNNVRCAVLTFPDMLSCHLAHMLQRTVKVKDKYMPIYLMSEMVINSKLKPAKLKETDEENHTRITFNALWQNLISAVEEIKQTKNPAENENSSKNGTTTASAQSAKRKLSNADSFAASAKQPKVPTNSSATAAKTVAGLKIGPGPIPVSQLTKYLDEQEAKKSAKKSAAAGGTTIKSESSTVSSTSSAKTSAAQKTSAAVTPKTLATITLKTSTPQKTSEKAPKTLATLGSARTQPVAAKFTAGSWKNPQKTSAGGKFSSANRTTTQKSSAAAAVGGSPRFGANARQSAAATSARSNVVDNRRSGLQSIFDVRVPAPTAMEMQQHQHMQQAPSRFSQWEGGDVPPSPGPRSILSAVPGYQYNNLMDSSVNAFDYDGGLFPEPDFSANIGSSFDYNQNLRSGGGMFNNAANYSAPASLGNNPFLLSGDSSATRYGGDGGYGGMGGLRDDYGGGGGIGGFLGDYGGNAGGGGGFQGDYDAGGGFHDDYGGIGGGGFHGNYGGGGAEPHNWDRTTMSAVASSRPSAFPPLLMPGFQGFNASPTQNMTMQRQPQQNRFKSPSVKYGRQYPTNSGRSAEKKEKVVNKIYRKIY